MRETREPIECLVCQSERVMRAAPDLLAAGKAVLACADNHHPRMAAALHQLRAAVKKAERTE